MKPLRLALFPDYPAEGWPSMDLCAEMLHTHLGPALAGRVQATWALPPFRPRITQSLGRRKWTHNADRLLNRWLDYPLYARRQMRRFAAFHVVDHSNAQLVRVLPAERTGVLVHDVDTFRSVLEPERVRRGNWFRALAWQTLRGLQQAALVFYTTAAVRADLLRWNVVEPSRLIQALPGIAAEFAPAGPTPNAGPYVLHVGSTIARKRIDVLLDVFAELRRSRPDLRLEQIGGTWTTEQAEQIRHLGLTGFVRQRRGLSRTELAMWYRGAIVVLQPSSAEGFGLPLVEALACGAPVVASDLPVLREVAGPAAVYAPVADVPAWSAAVTQVLHGQAPARAERCAWAGRYSWHEHARTIGSAYQRLLACA
jgi:glycosyltransferase involved in cell wall biosynthesis